MQQRTAAIYARQSVDRPDSISIESQIEFCQYELKGSPFRAYCDKGYSGKNTERPQFQQLMYDIERGCIDTVVVYKLDRISRSILDFSNMMEFFQRYQVEFISSTEKFDTSTPMGRAMLNICIVFAQLERETIQKRVSDAYYSRSRKGLHMGGKPPFGFFAEPFVMDGIHTKRLTVCPEEAQLVEQIFLMYANPNTSYGDITRYFSKKGFTFRGRELSRSTLAQLLKNPVYVKADQRIYRFFEEQGTTIVNPAEDFTGTNGCYLYQGQNATENKLHSLSGQMLVLAPHQGIIPADLWLQCREKVQQNKKIHPSGKAIHTWLAGRIKCRQCGYALISMHNTSGRHYLRCAKRLDNKSCPGCGKIFTAQVEQFVYLEMVKKMLELRLAGVHAVLGRRQKQYNQLLEELEEIEQQIQKLIDAITSPTSPLLEYITVRVEQLDNKKRELLQQTDQLAPEKITPRLLTEVGRAIENWPQTTFEEKRRAVGILIERVCADEAEIVIEWKI